MLPFVEEANKKLVRIEPYFKDDNAVFFEKWTFGNEQAIADFLTTYWVAPIVLCMLYGAGLYFGQKWMAKRPPFQLRSQLIIWNVFMAMLSVAGTYRCFTDTVIRLRDYGFLSAVCHPAGYDGITGFWAITYLFSKPLEFVDSVFIVLRKQHLQTLHWYHHMAVLCFSFYNFIDFVAIGRLFGSVNYMVHAIMYSYFALRAARVSMPQFFAIGVTSLQIIQMVVGLVAVSYVFYAYNIVGVHCAINNTSILSAFLMYLSFFVMFAQFFSNKYIGSHHTKKSAMNGHQKKSE